MTEELTEAAQEFDGALVLVIDDEATQRLLTRDCLEQDGFRIEEASSGEEGLRLIRELHPDLVLLDIMMPGIDGFETCRRLRADPDICHTPVIVVTGREDIEDVKRGFAVGATDFLTKPVIWNLLPSRVRFVLRTSRLEHDLRLAKDAAEQASEAKSTLLSTMGHELRTPLNAIIGFSEIMKQGAFGPVGAPQYEEFVVDMHHSGTRLLNAINAILEIVKYDSGGLERQMTEIGLVNLVDSVIREASAEAIASRIQVVNSVSDLSVTLICDQERLRQALYQVVSNAVKFTENGGVVRINAATSAGGLTISIADNGIGISPDDLPRVVEPFEQADSSLARNYEGLGLGIPLARAFVRLHGGDIEIESTPGQGTTVRINLPESCLAVSRHLAVVGSA
jgi:signal transduction histidine kinase